MASSGKTGKVQGQCSLSHGRARREDDKVGRLESREHVVEGLEAGRNSAKLSLCLMKALNTCPGFWKRVFKREVLCTLRTFCKGKYFLFSSV